VPESGHECTQYRQKRGRDASKESLPVVPDRVDWPAARIADALCERCLPAAPITTLTRCERSRESCKSSCASVSNDGHRLVAKHPGAMRSTVRLLPLHWRGEAYHLAGSPPGQPLICQRWSQHWCDASFHPDANRHTRWAWCNSLKRNHRAVYKAPWRWALQTDTHVRIPSKLTGRQNSTSALMYAVIKLLAS
jgi:hypothetical protein